MAPKMTLHELSNFLAHEIDVRKHCVEAKELVDAQIVSEKAVEKATRARDEALAARDKALAEITDRRAKADAEATRAAVALQSQLATRQAQADKAVADAQSLLANLEDRVTRARQMVVDEESILATTRKYRADEERALLDRIAALTAKEQEIRERLQAALR